MGERESEDDDAGKDVRMTREMISAKGGDKLMFMEQTRCQKVVLVWF